MTRMNSGAKPFLAILFSIALLSSCFQGGGSSLTPNSSGSQAGERSPGAALNADRQPIALTFVRETTDLDHLLKQFPGETLEDNRWTRIYEQELGIRIKYDWTAKGDQYRQKLGISLATGNIPDVVRVDSQQLRELSNAGLIQDLSEVYAEYASPFTKQVLSQEGSGPFEAAKIDGKLAGIPETSSSIEGAQYVWVRTDWLDTLGLQPPRTMEELLAISKAFTEDDPDRNGMKDTHGLAITNYIWDPVAGLMGFMAGYGAYPRLWLKDDSGRLVFGGIQPEVKAALRTLQEMYRSGQIDGEFAMKDGAKVKNDTANGKIGIVYGEQWSSFWLGLSRERNPKADWQAYPIVGIAGLTPQVPLPFSTNQYLAVRKGYAHPEAIVKLINLHLEKNWGATAEYETYYSTPYPAWQLSPVTPFPPKKNLEAYLQLAEARRTGNKSVLRDEAKAIQKNIDLYLAGGPDKETGWGWERTYGPSGAFAILDQYERNGRLLYENFVGGPTKTMIEKQSILNNLLYDTYINIILGNPIADFDRFVEEWRRLGGDKITAEVNEWYIGRGRNLKE
ncbi:extracellular solute-binding protein [Cohnella panacarvi]|uniref:extracellular solute-binding protein n=1 Tax=Cohnella panacarvi TaxID=400776 RepID=UPI0004B452D6|nr:extracellular solute-binding protein [Cohnella panacarvi]